MARNADQAAVASDWENRWCRGSIQSGDAVAHGCGSGFTSVAVQASLHNVQEWPKVSFSEADCKQYASEGGP
jgi:anaerobic glycerol-3-phosphate dehydrogenase